MDIKILSKRDLEKVLEMPKVIEAVEKAYKLKAEGEVVAWPLVEHHFPDGAEMDIRSGGVFGEVGFHGAKLLNDFPGNAAKGLMVFTGVLMVFDSSTGHPIGVMDASLITSMRTGAAGAVSTRAFARQDASVLTLVGAGRQAFYQAGAVICAMPNIREIIVADPINQDLARQFASEAPERLKRELDIDAGGVTFRAEELETAVRKADCIITVTRATRPVVRKEWVSPGTHITCIGADMVGKEEIDPELFVGSRVFCDDIQQCIRVGESEIPFKEGYIREEDLMGEIGQVLSGKITGRMSADDITIFDATGLAALDLITAGIAVEQAKEKNIGSTAEI